MAGVRLVGRLLLVAMFLMSGSQKLATYNPSTGGPMAGERGRGRGGARRAATDRGRHRLSH
jgi:uncharacterized membrane protein YphA (DoxX/SURF4 family)